MAGWDEISQMSVTAAWWNNHYDENDEQLRDPGESMVQRRSRYVRQIADAHGVDEKSATGALKHVYDHASSGSIFSSPTDYGFASQARKPYSHATERKLMEPKTWEGKQAEDIPLHQPIHASQDFIRPHSIAHNLFHPGKPQPIYDETVGDPDHDPSWDEDIRDDMDDSEESESPEHKKLSETPRFMRRTNGRLDVVDGHHRVATDMLLGKSHTRGVIVHERDLH